MAVTEWQKNLAMRITMSRIFMVPVIVAAMWPNTLPWNIVAAILFVLASTTDYFDGHLSLIHI